MGLRQRLTNPPVPTEFKGITMRSKSEAIFAACLHFAGWGWEYEPPTPLHRWDFWAWKENCRQSTDGPDADMFSRRVFIEYKPGRPTMTYIRNLTQTVRQWAERMASGERVFESYVVWGSPLAKHGYNFIEESPFVCYPVFTRHGKYGWGDFNPWADIGEDAPFSYRHVQSEILGITGEHVAMALAYRFDLMG